MSAREATRARKAALWSALAACLVAGVTAAAIACGGGDDDGEETVGPTPAATAVPTATASAGSGGSAPPARVCELISQDEVSAIVGGDVATVEGSPTACLFRVGQFSTTISVHVRDFAPIAETAFVQEVEGIGGVEIDGPGTRNLWVASRFELHAVNEDTRLLVIVLSSEPEEVIRQQALDIAAMLLD